MIHRRFLILTLLLSFAVAEVLAGAPEARAGTAAPVPSALTQELRKKLGSDDKAAWPDGLRTLYAARHHVPAWIDGNGLTERGARLLAVLEGATTHGLQPGYYHLPALLALRDSRKPDRLARLDLLLSDALLRFVADLRRGQLDPRSVDRDWGIIPAEIDAAAIVTRIMAAPDPAAALAEMAPPYASYLALQQALERYRAIAAAGGWPVIGDGPTLREGDSDDRIIQLRQRLAVTGELAAASEDPAFDADVVAALKVFQSRHGLAEDGVLGPRTRTALNTPVQERIAQILVNLERWRWVPRRLEPVHLAVNLAGAYLELVKDGVATQSMRVIVGDRKHQTPVMRDVITSVTVNPPWYVPTSIARKEILPHLQGNPLWLAQNRMTIVGQGSDDDPEGDDNIDWLTLDSSSFPFRLRQAPGPDNSLGRLKFNTTNAFNIYLHDTPGRHLFARDRRALSHGCIRLEAPLDLAHMLLEGHQGWDRERLQQAIDAVATRTIPLKAPVPVYFFYWTAWVGSDGTVQFREDVYGRDRLVHARLQQKRKPPQLARAEAGNG